MSQDEFAETPYAASFGPVPVVYQPQEEERESSAAPTTDEPMQEVAKDEETVDPPLLAKVANKRGPPAGQNRQEKTYSSRASRLHIPSADEVVMDDNMIQSLSAAERLSQIDINDTNTWDYTVNTVITGLRSIQMQWNTLEAEKKSIVRPGNAASAQPYTARGTAGRRRGRTRGRRRGRARGI